MSSNGLSTTWVHSQTALLLLSTLLGSVFGVMGVVGEVMKQFENQTLNVKGKIDKSQKMQNLKEVSLRLKNDLEKFSHIPDHKNLTATNSLPQSEKLDSGRHSFSTL